MLVISIPSADLCLNQQIEENVNGRAIFVIVVVERIRIFITGIANLFWIGNAKRLTNKSQNRMDIDRSKAEKDKFT